MTKRKKIGKGYWAGGYGRGFQSRINIWLINGRAYAYNPKYAEETFEPLTGDLTGYIPVNYCPIYGTFGELGIYEEHKQYRLTDEG